MNKEKLNQNWLHDLFINEAKAAKNYHNRGGGGGSGESGGSVSDVSSTDKMDSILANATQEDVGKAFIYTGETTDSYENGAIYIVREVE